MVYKIDTFVSGNNAKTYVMKYRSAYLIIAAAIIAAAALTGCRKEANVCPATIFGDSMVLQRDVPVPIWGTANPGAKVKFSLVSADSQKDYETRADSEGKWKVLMDARPAGGPYELRFEEFTISDVLYGDVYIGSGQSNMELPVRRCMDAVAADVKGYSNNNIRYIKVPLSYEFKGPAEDLHYANWEVASSDSAVTEWGAVLYFTARYLQAATGVPVGMINSSVGGSPIEAWIGEQCLPGYALEELKFYKDEHNLDSIKNFNANLYTEWQAAHNALPANTEAKWEDVDIFTVDWAEDEKGQAICGSHFFTRTVDLTEEEAAGEAILHLGAIVDADSVFVNGTFVGNTTYMYPPRNYKVPAGVLKAGSNEIEIHLYSYGNVPAFVPGKRYSLETGAAEKSLLKGWRHKAGRRMPPRPGEVFLQYKSAGLFNAMIAPIKEFPTSGVIWYQGESNCFNAADYGNLLETMITEWRSEMGNPTLKFYIIELAAFEHSELTDNDFGWNRVQKEQKRTAERMDGVYFVPNGDLGEWNDIHPQDKKTVGLRTSNTILDSNK